ncbi:phosphoribosylglycinamide formyltransferase [Minwuia thermotolerans]|uniref:Phosphoribosylglycinamide formyltransferase n=1 Tax=Minwuia thermotolerans TaxID=2056226 RepID=A0A2M9FVW1_9PROT|nr:phosphoribosylglycinamide formyltransferase [Minwuia thermotolerans]PJK27602.1 phosphoribosylglycinamide formyltransferase [Minwuia thermotolerans]
MASLKLGVLISGRGTNLQALIDACAADAFPAEIALVVSNVGGAAGLERARKAGIHTLVIDHREFESRAKFDEAVASALETHDVGLVCLAGFLRILSKAFVDRWRDRIINIHPSLLPAFKGLHVHERVLEAGVRITGCTVHFIRPEMDEGPIIVQGAVPVLADDTPETLAGRVLEVEHRIYPLAVRLIAEGKARVVGDIVNLPALDAGDGPLLNPGD